MDLDIIKYKDHKFDISETSRNILTTYLELYQLSDYMERYGKEPENKSDAYMANYNYNKELDKARTIFDEEGLKAKLAINLCALVWQVISMANNQRPDVDFVNLNKIVKDSVAKKVENKFVYNPGMTLAGIRQFFTPNEEFIPKNISNTIIEQILKYVLDMCVQFDLSFSKGWDKCCENVINY